MRAKREIVLTLRDFEILQFVFEQRAVSCKQLAQRFFSTASFKAAHARLEKLITTFYLEKSYSLWNGTRTVVYGITKKGVKSIGENYHYQITGEKYKSDSVNHDLGLVVLRKRLEKVKMVANYFSESMLQNCSELSGSEKYREFSVVNSDAALAIDTTKNQFQAALEYEISDKKKSRYNTKLVDYYFSPSVALVLYVCGNARIEKLIRAADLEVGAKHKAKVFTCLEENFHKADGYLPFTNRNNAIFKLE
jgi:hypothetical protein